MWRACVQVPSIKTRSFLLPVASVLAFTESSATASALGKSSSGSNPDCTACCSGSMSPEKETPLVTNTDFMHMEMRGTLAI